jgi:SAM-dependent methyltransferase
VGDPQGLLFDAAVRDYEDGRTGWPDTVTEGMEAEDVLDLAAGTGKLTRLLVRRFPRVTAVEPLAGMRALGCTLVPEAEWRAGTAEAVPTPRAAFDAAFVAEAYHWFDPESATAELARVLRPGGSLVVLFTAWNGSFEPGLSEEAHAAVRAVADRTGPTGAAKVATGAWRSAFDAAPFQPLQEGDLPFEHITDRDGVIAYYLSMSSIAARPEQERDTLRHQLRSLVPGGEHQLSLRALVYTTRRL